MIWGIFDNKAKLKEANFTGLIYFAPGSMKVDPFISVMYLLHTFTP
jgi:hypothetical protein